MDTTKLAGLAIALLLAAAPAPAASLGERYQSVMLALSRRPDLSTAEKAERLSNEYAQYFEPVARKPEVPPEDLQALFDASNMLASYTLHFRHRDNPRYVQAMIQAHGSLRSSGRVSESNDQNLYGALVAARRFGEATELARTSPSLRQQTVPAFDIAEGFDPARPGYFEFPAVGGRLALRNADAPGDGVRVIVVGACHFAQDAARGIASDADLRQAFLRGRALWLAPADRTFDPAEVQRWNADFPDIPIRIAFNHAAWKGLDFTQQPTFFFFKGDRLIGKSVGWGRSGPPQALLTALRESGLLP